jgi:hypothetical protein
MEQGNGWQHEQNKMAGMCAPSEAIKHMGSGINLSMQHARVVTSVEDQGKQDQTAAWIFIG